MVSCIVVQTEVSEEHAPDDSPPVPRLGKGQDLAQSPHVVLEPRRTYVHDRCGRSWLLNMAYRYKVWVTVSEHKSYFRGPFMLITSCTLPRFHYQYSDKICRQNKFITLSLLQSINIFTPLNLFNLQIEHEIAYVAKLGRNLSFG